MYTRASLLILLLLLACQAHASPPLPSDVSLQMSVETQSLAPYPPGASGQLTLTVTLLEGSASMFFISTDSTLLPLDTPAPVRFTATGNGDDCQLQEVTDGSNFEGRYWFMLWAFDIDGQARCRINFEVLDISGNEPISLRFYAKATMFGSAGYFDTNPDDNFADFILGNRGVLPVPIPGPTTLIWLLVAVMLLAIGMITLLPRSTVRLDS